MKKAHQYIVTGRGPIGTQPCELTLRPEYPRAGILFHGDHATVFSSRERAQNAIDRTIVWGEQQRGLNGKWICDWAVRENYKIYRLIPQEEAK